MQLYDKKGMFNPISSFDAVITDLFIPASIEGINPALAEKFQGQEMPYGLVFAMTALLQGVKYVAILTDTDHHNNPIVWGLDPLKSIPCSMSNTPSTFMVCNFMTGVGESRVKDYVETLQRLTTEDSGYTSMTGGMSQKTWGEAIQLRKELEKQHG